MALTLDGAITAADRQLAVNETVPEEIGPEYLFRIDDEVLRLVQFVSEDPPNPRPIDRQLWYVERAYGGSVAASHDNGVEIKGARDAWTSSSDEEQPDPFPAGDSLSSNIVDALNAADTPSAANPFVTGIRTHTVDLPSAQLMTLASLPPTILPAVEGKFLRVESVTGYLRVGSQVFANGAAPRIRYDDAAESPIAQTNTPLTGTRDTVIRWGPDGAPESGPISDLIGAGVVLTADADFDSAPGTGSMRVVTRYEEVEVLHLASIEFLVQPTDVDGDEVFSVSVRALDQNGDAYTGPDMEIDLTIGDGFFLGGTTEVMTDPTTGVAVFSDLYVEPDPTPGPTTLTATVFPDRYADGTVDVESVSFNVAAIP